MVTRVCKKYQVPKALEDFQHRKGTERRHICKLCASKAAKNYPSYKTRSYNKESLLRRDLQRHYGITLADYDALFVQQGGVCRICKLPPSSRRLAVDHDHDTKIIRGLLCGSCNRGLGLFRDDPSLLLCAKAYLEVVR